MTTPGNIFWCIIISFALGCAGSPSSASTDANYIEFLSIKGDQVKTHRTVTPSSFMNQVWLGDYSKLRAIDNQYFAIRKHSKVFVINRSDFSIARDLSLMSVDRKYEWVNLWHRSRVVKEPIQYQGITSDSLISKAILEELQFNQELEPEFSTVFKVSSERLDSNRYRVNKFENVQNTAGQTFIFSQATIYDLVTDSLQTSIYENIYLKSFRVFQKQEDTTTVFADFNPGITYTRINFHLPKGLVGDHHAYFFNYDRELFIHDITSGNTELLNENPKLRSPVAVDKKLIYATSDRVVRYDPVSKKTEVLHDPSKEITAITLKPTSNLQKLFVGYAVDNVNNQSETAMVLHIDLATGQTTELFSEEYPSYAGRRFALFSNFIQIDDTYYTTISFHDP